MQASKRKDGGSRRSKRMAIVVENTTSSVHRGFIALVDLKKGSQISLDGVPIALQQADGLFGFREIEFDTDVFHLVAIRGATSDSGNRKNVSAITVGFVVLDASLVRRYDAQTEEVSSSTLDEQTIANLTMQINDSTVPSSRLVTYNQVLSIDQGNRWKNRTRFISRRLLHKRGLFDGNKVVPGSYDDNGKSVDQPKIVDGESVSFPNIPVLDSANEGLRSCSHLGTRQYLKELPPDVRTTLFLDPNPSARLLQDVLQRYYDGNWRDLLGDLQLAFVLVLNLQCFSSLECW